MRYSLPGFNISLRNIELSIRYWTWGLTYIMAGKYWQPSTSFMCLCFWRERDGWIYYGGKIFSPTYMVYFPLDRGAQNISSVYYNHPLWICFQEECSKYLSHIPISFCLFQDFMTAQYTHHPPINIFIWEINTNVIAAEYCPLPFLRIIFQLTFSTTFNACLMCMQSL